MEKVIRSNLNHNYHDKIRQLQLEFLWLCNKVWSCLRIGREMKNKHIRICGTGRSGSTAIGAYIAGHLSDTYHGGEIVRLTDEKSLNSRGTQLCSCGKLIKDCAYFQTVGIDGTQTLNYEAITQQLRQGGHFVDTSKTFRDHIKADLDIHLIKDPRATTWAWFRKKEIKTKYGDLNLQKIKIKNLPRHIMYEYKYFIKYRFQKLMIIRYEDFVADPDKFIKIISDKLSIPRLIEYHSKHNHGIGGNTGKFDFNGRLFLDEKWKKEAPWWLRGILHVSFLPIIIYLKFYSQNY